MEHVIKAAVERGASDVHIKAGDVWRARIDGELTPLTKQRLTPEQTKTIALKLIPSPEVRERIDTLRDYDCTWGTAGVGRFRVNILRQRSSFMIVMRVIPFDVPTFDKLGLPPVMAEIASSDHGLILLTGVTGSGCTSSVAAMIHHINTNAHKHVISLESPIEFLHRDLNSSVTQREVGVDTASYQAGLQTVLRQDSDVVVIGGLHDDVVFDQVLKATESGRLVIATTHAPDVTSAVAQVMALIPGDRREIVRVRFAESLRAIVAQQLLPSVKSGEQCLAAEILLGTDAVRTALADRSRAGDIYGLMADGHDENMQTFEQHLFDLVTAKLITMETATAGARVPEELLALEEALQDPGAANRRVGSRERRRNVRDRRRK